MNTNPPVDDRPETPKASDYSGKNLDAYKRGRAAARRYYRGLAAGKHDSYCGYIERADARNERSAWYDGFDAIANPEYFRGN